MHLLFIGPDHVVLMKWIAVESELNMYLNWLVHDLAHKYKVHLFTWGKKYNVFPFEMDNIFDFATECEMTTTS